MNRNIRWKAAIRDVVIIWILTMLGGFVVGVTGATDDKLMIGYAYANFIFGIVGFTISGCMSKTSRWRHLFIVAIGVWLVGVVNVFFIPMTVLQWLLGFFFVLIIMGIGGGLSYIFVRNLTPSDIIPIDRSTPDHKNELKE